MEREATYRDRRIERERGDPEREREATYRDRS